MNDPDGLIQLDLLFVPDLSTVLNDGLFWQQHVGSGNAQTMESLQQRMQLLVEAKQQQRASIMAAASAPPLVIPRAMDAQALIVTLGLDPERVHPRQLLNIACTQAEWASAVREWLRSPTADRFWQRVCVGLLPPGKALHPELCSKQLLLEWVSMPMATGSLDQLERCSALLPEQGEIESTIELELASMLAETFVLWWNVALEDRSPRPVGWHRLYFKPYLNGFTHELAADPERRLLAMVCDCLADFNMWMKMNCSQAQQMICAPAALSLLLESFELRFNINWAHIPTTSAKTNRFNELLRRWAPLFPQQSDTEQLVPVAPRFRIGGRHVYPKPRPLCWPVLRGSDILTDMLMFDPGNTDAYQEFWKFDTRTASNYDEEEIEGEIFDEDY